MQGIKTGHSQIQRTWHYVGTTLSNDPAWAFDRLRLYYPTDRTEIGLFSLLDYNAGFRNIADRWCVSSDITPTYGSQKFSSTNDFEHDFTFDLSGAPPTERTFIMMRGWKNTAEFQQIYSDVTGVDASRGKNSDLFEWDFSRINTTDNIGGSDTSIIMSNNTLSILRWMDYEKPKMLRASLLDFSNNSLNDSMTTTLLEWADWGGVLNGTLDYSGNYGVPFERCWEEYNNLLSKGWTIIGNQPSGVNPEA